MRDISQMQLTMSLAQFWRNNVTEKHVWQSQTFCEPTIVRPMSFGEQDLSHMNGE